MSARSATNTTERGTMKSSTKLGLLAVAATALLAWPVYSLASNDSTGGDTQTKTTTTHTQRGKHCGKGHAKHAKKSPQQGGLKIGQSCQKQAHPRSNSNA